MLSGDIGSRNDIPEGDFRRLMPRFQPENLDVNLQLVKQVQELAKQKGCTPAQLAISWTIAQSTRPGMPRIIPIPGATTVERVVENSKTVEIRPEELDKLDAIIAKFEIKGDRYPPEVPVNT